MKNEIFLYYIVSCFYPYTMYKVFYFKYASTLTLRPISAYSGLSIHVGSP